MGIFTKLFSGAGKSFESNGGFTLTSSMFESSSKYKKYSHEELLALYKGWVFACSDLIGDGMTLLNSNLYKNELKADIVSHDYIKLIDAEKMKALSIFLKTLGECYFFKVKAGKKILELKLLKPWNVVEKTGEMGEVLYYSYTDGTSFYRFEVEDVIAFKTFSPVFEQSGMTPLKAVAAQVAMDLSSIEYNRLFFENGGKPGTILKSEKSIDSDVREKYLAKYKANFVGLQNSNKVAFLDNGIEIQDFSANQKDMELTNQRMFTMDEVLMIFRVPKPLLGKSDGVGFADKQVPGYYFTEYCLKTLGNIIAGTLNKDEDFKKAGFFAFEYPQDKDELIKEYQNNLITTNMYLRATGRPEFQSGNRLWDGTEVIEVTEKQVESRIEKHIKEALMKGINSKDFGSEEYNEKQWKAKIKRTDKYEIEMSKIQKKIFNAQQREILSNLSDTKGIKKVEKEEDLFDKKKSNLMYISLYTSFFEKFMKAEGEIAISEITDEEFVIARTNKWIGENIDRMSDDIDNVTRKEIFEIVKQGNRDKVGAAAIATMVRSKFNQYTRKSGRVEKIVRTEITRASNKSQDEAYVQSGVVESKQWYTALDERVSSECAALHGMEVAVGGTFIKKGDKDPLGNKITYESIKYPPRHVNCRCTLRPIISVKSFKQVKERFEKKGITFNI